VRSPHPPWDGKPAPEKTLLVYNEQGAGDAIQFARYLPMAAERCKRVVLACRPDLSAVFATIPGVAHIREPGEIKVGDFDTHLPMLSLPYVFGTTPETIPSAVPYIDAAALRRRKENPALALPPSPRFNIGIAWAGSPINRTDRQRSCALKDFLPILHAAGANFFSLQKGERAKDLGDLPSAVNIHDLDPLLGDFGDLAILIDQLDLVIAVDTSVAHMAGALGKPVWTLLSDAADWRWGLTGETTPWYPTMSLFRQSEPGDWSGVIQRVADALRDASARR
jgi:hypothetical protein